MIKYSFNKKIIPKKLICNGNMYRIKILSSKFIITDFEIYTNQNKNIEKITITKGLHPNCNPDDGVFCIPDYLKNLKMCNETIKIIKEMFEIFNFESAYYLPWYAIDYDRRYLNE